ncbi:MAG: PAS domain S-box protein [Bacteroidota bacterium]
MENRTTAISQKPALLHISSPPINAGLEQMAAVAHFHPDPMLQISGDGTIIVENIAASLLKEFCYNGVRLAAAKFFKTLAGTLEKIPGIQAIHVTCDNRSVTFKCNYYAPDNSFLVYGNEVKEVPGNTIPVNISDIANRVGPLMENLQDGILLEDENRTLLLTNSSFCKIFGIKESPSSLIGVDCWKLTKKTVGLFQQPDEFIRETRQLISKRLRAGNHEFTLKDGRVLKREFTPIKNSNGVYMGNMWIFNDITQMSVAKKNLESQRTFYETILNKLPADIAVYDKQFRYRYINPKSLQNTETRKWIIGKTDHDYFQFRNKPIHTAEIRKQYLQQVIETRNEIRWEEDSNDAEGLLHTHLRILTPIVDDDDNVQMVMGYGLEITDRKQIEQQVKLSEKRYRELINCSQGIIITHDVQGLIKSINPAVEKILGFPAELVIGQNLVSFLPPEDREQFQSFYLSSLLETGSVEGVLRIFNNQGKRVYLLYKNVMVNEVGSEPYIIGFSQDITERIIAEHELEVAREVTEEGSKAKERFLANMSHEIRTPMNGIIGIANLLQKTSLNTKQQNFLSLILESANNLTVIINDILDLEKIIAGKLEFESIPFNINEKVKLVVDSFRYKAEEKDITLLIESELPNDLFVCGDPYRLSQILTNLISNAIKFTDFGQITLSIKTLSTTGDNQVISLCIIDTGIGISADKLVAIFDPYVQERSEISRKYGGTGLGLAICKNLVDMQGGTMTVNSDPGKGSCFTINIPYKKSSGNINQIEFENDFKQLVNKHILVAEDVEINQFLVNHILVSWGCIVTIVSNGKEAFEQVSANHFDAILMDIQMPVMDGIECTKKIRSIKNKTKANIPVIALTANALKGDDEKYYSAGMNGYLTKPFTENALYNILVQSLNLELNSAINYTHSNMPLQIQTELPSSEPPLYDLSFLQGMSGNDPNFVPMMAKLFVETVPGIIQKLSDAKQINDWKMAGTLAHKLKPTIDTMHISSLSNVIRIVELYGRTETETADLPTNISLVISTMNQCIAKIKTEFNLV